VLDVVATVALLAAAGVVIWTQLARSAPAAPSRPAIPIPTEPVSLEGAPILGDPAAKVVMIEFSDFECPFCARFAAETLPEIKAQYVEAGKVKLAFRHFPLDRIHPRARPAAEASECAARHGQFWVFRELLFANPQKLQDKDLLTYAQTVGLDLEAFAACAKDGAAARVNADVELVSSLGLRSTPTFLLGLVDGNGHVRIQEILSGALPFAVFSGSLDRLVRTAR
jgi:protein-disulfide isomerase